MRRHLHIFPPLLCSSARNEIEANTEMRAAEADVLHLGLCWGSCATPWDSPAGQAGYWDPILLCPWMKAVLECTVSICDSEHQRADPQWDTQVMVHPGAMTGHEKECDLERKPLLPPHP